MNDDASSGVAADVRFGAQAPSSLDALAWISFAIGLVALAGGGCLLYLGFRRWGRTPTSDIDNTAMAPQNETPPEPAGSEPSHLAPPAAGAQSATPDIAQHRKDGGDVRRPDR